MSSQPDAVVSDAHPDGTVPCSLSPPQNIVWLTSSVLNVAVQQKIIRLPGNKATRLQRATDGEPELPQQLHQTVVLDDVPTVNEKKRPDEGTQLNYLHLSDWHQCAI
jgi:hypothetical protein